MSNQYATLAPIYDRLGMAAFAEETTPRLLNYIQRNGWMGRRIMDFGCGTGASALWLSGRSYIVTGVDSSAAMLEQARSKAQEQSASTTWLERDIRDIGSVPQQVDLLLALQTLNELGSLREMEAAFQSARKVLVPDRLFVFDMLTIEGLTQHSGESMAHESDDLLVMRRDSYDYDRQIQTRDYTIFAREDGDLWRRQETQRVLRAYPVQAIVSLLKRSQFEDITVLDTSLSPYTPGKKSTPHVIFMAKLT